MSRHANGAGGSRGLPSQGFFQCPELEERMEKYLVRLANQTSNHLIADTHESDQTTIFWKPMCTIDGINVFRGFERPTSAVRDSNGNGDGHGHGNNRDQDNGGGHGNQSATMSESQTHISGSESRTSVMPDQLTSPHHDHGHGHGHPEHHDGGLASGPPRPSSANCSQVSCASSSGTPPPPPNGSYEPVYLRGITKVNACIEEFAMLFKLDSSKRTKEHSMLFNADLVKTVTLYNIVQPSGEHPRRYVGIKWCAVQSPSKLFHDRDFCFLECQKEFQDKNGRRGWVRSFHSIKMPCCPPLEKTHGLVRASLYRCGLIAVESDKPGVLHVTYILEMDLKGHFPEMFHRAFLAKRIGKLAAIDRFLQRQRLSSCQLLGDLDIPSHAHKVKCHFCFRSFNAWLRKHVCRKCGEVVCRHCSNEWELEIPMSGTKKVRICTVCSAEARMGHSLAPRTPTFQFSDEYLENRSLPTELAAYGTIPQSPLSASFRSTSPRGKFLDSYSDRRRAPSLVDENIRLTHDASQLLKSEMPAPDPKWEEPQETPEQDKDKMASFHRPLQQQEMAQRMNGQLQGYGVPTQSQQQPSPSHQPVMHQTFHVGQRSSVPAIRQHAPRSMSNDSILKSNSVVPPAGTGSFHVPRPSQQHQRSTMLYDPYSMVPPPAERMRNTDVYSSRRESRPHHRDPSRRGMQPNQQPQPIPSVMLSSRSSYYQSYYSQRASERPHRGRPGAEPPIRVVSTGTDNMSSRRRTITTLDSQRMMAQQPQSPMNHQYPSQRQMHQMQMQMQLQMPMQPSNGLPNVNHHLQQQQMYDSFHRQSPMPHGGPHQMPINQPMPMSMPNGRDGSGGYAPPSPSMYQYSQVDPMWMMNQMEDPQKRTYHQVQQGPILSQQQHQHHVQQQQQMQAPAQTSHRHTVPNYLPPSQVLQDEPTTPANKSHTAISGGEGKTTPESPSSAIRFPSCENFEYVEGANGEWVVAPNASGVRMPRGDSRPSMDTPSSEMQGQQPQRPPPQHPSPPQQQQKQPPQSDGKLRRLQTAAVEAAPHDPRMFSSAKAIKTRRRGRSFRRRASSMDDSLLKHFDSFDLEDDEEEIVEPLNLKAKFA